MNEGTERASAGTQGLNKEPNIFVERTKASFFNLLGVGVQLGTLTQFAALVYLDASENIDLTTVRFAASATSVVGGLVSGSILVSIADMKKRRIWEIESKRADQNKTTNIS